MRKKNTVAFDCSNISLTNMTKEKFMKIPNTDTTSKIISQTLIELVRIGKDLFFK